MSTKSSSRFTPVIIAISVVIGILIGTFYAKHFAGNRLGCLLYTSTGRNPMIPQAQSLCRRLQSQPPSLPISNP